MRKFPGARQRKSSSEEDKGHSGRFSLDLLLFGDFKMLFIPFPITTFIYAVSIFKKFNLFFKRIFKKNLSETHCFYMLWKYSAYSIENKYPANNRTKLSSSNRKHPTKNN